MLKDIQFIQKEATTIYVDNKSAIELAKNPVYHERSKHIDTRFHYIREHVKNKEIEVKFVKSQDQIADIFTKPFKIDAFKRFRSMLGMIDGENFGLRGGVEKINQN